MRFHCTLWCASQNSLRPGWVLRERRHPGAMRDVRDQEVAHDGIPFGRGTASAKGLIKPCVDLLGHLIHGNDEDGRS